MLSSNPRIRVDIKSEVVSEEDASQSAVALTRVVTLLKEVCFNTFFFFFFLKNKIFIYSCRKTRQLLQHLEDFVDVESM